MIGDLSLSLRTLLTKGGADFAELSTAHIAFDRPTDSFSPSQPTVSLYLYDIRENTELRSNEPDVRVVNGRATVGRGPLRVVCTYLVTAWPGNVTGDNLALAEQTLLSQALMVFARHPRVPGEYLTGALVGQQPDLPLITAQAEGLRNPSEFWTALSNKLRPSLSVAVTISLQPAAPTDAALVVTNEIRLQSMPGTTTDLFDIGGLVTVTGGTPAVTKPAAGAVVSIKSIGRSSTTDAAGRYRLPAMAAGDYVAHVTDGARAQDVPLKIPAAGGYDLRLN